MRYFSACPQSGSNACTEAQAIFERLHDAQEDQSYADVLAMAAEVQEICAKCPHAAKDRAGALVRSGDIDHGEKLIDEMLSGGLGHDWRVLDLKGLARAKATGPEDALNWFQRAHAADPNRHSPNCSLADALCRLERYEEALPYARLARKTAPDDDTAANSLCIALAETGNTEELVQLGKESKPDNWSEVVLTNVGRALRMVGEGGLALTWFRLAIKKYPEKVAPTCQAAEMYLDLRKFPSALRLYKKLKKLDPTEHGALSSLNMAMIYGEEMGDWVRALNELIEARLAHADNRDVKAYLKYATDKLTRTAAETAEESEKWRRRFEAMRDEHSSLQQAVQQMHSGSEPGTPLAVGLVEGESQSIEFMKEYPSNARELAKEIAAFATSNDGTIYLGVTDDGDVNGIGGLESSAAKDRMQNRISGVSAGPVNPAAHVHVAFDAYEGKTVVRIFVPKGPEPVYYAGHTPYLRDVDRSRPAEAHEVEELIRQSQAT